MKLRRRMARVRCSALLLPWRDLVQCTSDAHVETVAYAMPLCRGCATKLKTQTMAAHDDVRDVLIGLAAGTACAPLKRNAPIHRDA